MSDPKQEGCQINWVNRADEISGSAKPNLAKEKLATYAEDLNTQHPEFEHEVQCPKTPAASKSNKKGRGG